MLLLLPVKISFTNEVPKAVPSLFQSSMPLVPLSAAKYKVPLTLTKGNHTLTITALGGGLYARMMDPDRKLRYPEK